MGLAEGKKGFTYKVLKIELDEAVVRRLEMLGMTIHSHVTILNRKRSGTMIISVRGTRFAIGKEFAKGIFVEETEERVEEHESGASH